MKATELNELLNWIEQNSFNVEDQAGVKMIVVDKFELTDYVFYNLSE